MCWCGLVAELAIELLSIVATRSPAGRERKGVIFVKRWLRRRAEPTAQRDRGGDATERMFVKPSRSRGRC